jgi:hypothetical protein
MEGVLPEPNHAVEFVAVYDDGTDSHACHPAMIAVVTKAISLTENRAGQGSLRLASCGATCSLVPSLSSDSQHEPKLIPAPVIVRFVDAYAIDKQTNEKCNRSNDSVPQPAPKSGSVAPGSLYLEFDPAVKREFAMGQDYRRREAPDETVMTCNS